MKLLNWGRGTGKTSLIVSTSFVTGYPIICRTLYNKKHILDVADKLNVPVDVFTFAEWRDMKDNMLSTYYPKDVKLLVDDGEELMKSALERELGTNIAALTMTVPMEDRNNDKNN